MAQLEDWELWYPQAAATGLLFGRSRVDAGFAVVLVHAALSRRPHWPASAETRNRLATVAQACPSGAIQYTRHDGGEEEQAPEVNLVHVRENGPLALRATLRIAGQPCGYRATLCRCGHSKNKPYCDGRHAPAGFVARLPRKLLSHPAGGALAVIGHVERAWGYSFLSPDASAHTGSFEDMVRELLSRQRVGWATESLNLRYADKATELSGVLEEESYEDTPKKSPYELAGLWTANNDARGYVVLGDPAVQLPLQQAGAAAQATPPAAGRPLEVNTPPASPAAAAEPAPASAPAPVVSASAAAPAMAPAPGDPTRLDAALQLLTAAVAQSIERSAARLATLEATDLDGFCKLVQLANGLRQRGPR